MSAAATGWILTLISLPQLFSGGGALLVAMAALAYLFTPMRHITNAAPAANEDSFHTKAPQAE